MSCVGASCVQFYMWSIGSDGSGRHFVSSSRQVYLPSFCCIRSFTHGSIAGSVLSISFSEIGKSLSTSGSAGRLGCPSPPVPSGSSLESLVPSSSPPATSLLPCSSPPGPLVPSSALPASGQLSRWQLRERLRRGLSDAVGALVVGQRGCQRAPGRAPPRRPLSASWVVRIPAAGGVAAARWYRCSRARGGRRGVPCRVAYRL